MYPEYKSFKIENSFGAPITANNIIEKALAVFAE
jgi:hypothetical protein